MTTIAHGCVGPMPPVERFRRSGGVSEGDLKGYSPPPEGVIVGPEPVATSA